MKPHSGAATGDCQRQHQWHQVRWIPQKTSQTEGSQPGGIGHFTDAGSVQNLWGVFWRKQNLGKGETKVLWEGGSVEIREKGDKRSWYKLFLAHTVFQLGPLPGHPSLSCLPNTHTAPEFGGLSGNHWEETTGPGQRHCSVLLMMRSKIYCEEQVIFPPTVLKFNSNNCRTQFSGAMIE